MPPHATSKHPPKLTYELEARLEGVEPPIWRRFQLSGETTVEELHLILQIVMGWENCRHYDIEAGGTSYGLGRTGDGRRFGRPPRRKTRLRHIVSAAGEGFRYRYDFDDDWRHRVRAL